MIPLSVCVGVHLTVDQESIEPAKKLRKAQHYTDEEQKTAVMFR